jgi:hypothetical protein
VGRELELDQIEIEDICRSWYRFITLWPDDVRVAGELRERWLETAALRWDAAVFFERAFGSTSFYLSPRLAPSMPELAPVYRASRCVVLPSPVRLYCSERIVREVCCATNDCGDVRLRS